MKTLIRCLIISVVLLSIIITTGCTTTQSPSPLPTKEVTPITTLLSVSTTTSNPPIASPTNTSIPIVSSTTQISKDDINQHFFDTAFGAGSNSLYRLSNKFSHGSELFHDITRISIDYDKSTYAQDSDSQVLQSFASEFNKYSKNLELRENRWDSPAELGIHVVSSSDFKNIIKSPAIIEHNGVIYAKSDEDQVRYSEIYPSTIIISNDLKGDERNYTIVRGLLYKLGFHGETLKYEDSIFYSDNTNNPILSYIDKKAIEIMYGSGMYPGMTKADAKKIVNPS
jgi:hypothetical protein